jgi:hypothetical protein
VAARDPHYIVLIFLTIGALLAAIFAWFAGRYPSSLFDFIEGVIRWHNRVAAYALLLITDRYPPYGLPMWTQLKAAADARRLGSAARECTDEK